MKGPSPSLGSGFRFGAKPPLSPDGVDMRFLVPFAARDMINPFSISTDVALDVAHAHDRVLPECIRDLKPGDERDQDG